MSGSYGPSSRDYLDYLDDLFRLLPQISFSEENTEEQTPKNSTKNKEN